jgi:hypothetical protein
VADPDYKWSEAQKVFLIEFNQRGMTEAYTRLAPEKRPVGSCAPLGNVHHPSRKCIMGAPARSDHQQPGCRSHHEGIHQQQCGGG